MEVLKKSLMRIFFVSYRQEESVGNDPLLEFGKLSSSGGVFNPWKHPLGILILCG